MTPDHDIAVFKTGDDADLPKANQVGQKVRVSQRCFFDDQ